MKKLTTIIILAFASAILLFTACSKGGGTVAPPPNPCAGITIVVAATVTPTTNTTTANGSIAASASGSSGFTFSINSGAFQSNGSFTNLAVGSYTITAKDANGCTGSASFNVTAAPCPAITVTGITTQASSPTANNGSIVATGNGSTGFVYSKDNFATTQATGTFLNLAPGAYTISVRDLNGCIGSNSFTVTIATCPTITLTATPTNTSGPSATNGSIAASATGGATPYTFSRDGGTTFQASGTFGNLAVGTYSVIAKDANGCLSAVSNITVSATCPTITASANTTTTVKCESNSGTITINASGSTGFMYNLNGGTFQTSNVFNLLGIGSFTFGVRDGNGCTTSGNTSITQAPAGTLFNQVKTILITNCAVSGCHNATTMQSGINFNDDCTIVAQKNRIKARAVDFNPSQMPPSGPPISAVNRQTIVDWINAGGRHNN
jgi:hypothetical protein